jgi:predicted DNA-binding transcriptional regulator AlpA
MKMDHLNDNMPSDDAAALLGVKPQTLAVWRSAGRGPKYLKIGRRCFYRRTDVDDWMNAQLRDPSTSRRTLDAEARS